MDTIEVIKFSSLHSMLMIRGVIFDFNRTLYDPDTKQLVSGATTILAWLQDRGCQLCLISKKSAEERELLISSLGLNRYFRKILVIEGSKQESHFQECLSAMALPASEVAVVGDRIREEIYLGNRMGMHTIWYRSGKFAAEVPENSAQLPRCIITSLEELPTCLSGEIQ